MVIKKKYKKSHKVLYEAGGDAAVYKEMVGLVAAKFGPLPLVFEIFYLVLVQYLQQFLLSSLFIKMYISAEMFKSSFFQTGNFNYTLVNYTLNFYSIQKHFY